MKQFFTLVLLFIVTQISARTLTLNNNNPSAGQYTTWAAVADAANNGDTILIQGSVNNYYTLNVNKRLVIIGPGHNPVDKQNAQKAFADAIVFYTGSNGSKVYGMEVSYTQAYENNIDSVEIHLCRMNDGFYAVGYNLHYWIFDGNVFASGGVNVHGQNRSMGDFTYRNNIFNGSFNNCNGNFIGYTYCNNNIFLASTPYCFQYCNYFYLNNNIFYRAGFVDYGNTGFTFTKNCSYQCQGGDNFPNGINYVATDPQFVTNIGTGDYFNYTTDYHLQAGSPLVSGGSDGNDVGVYGGYGDYEQNGVPHNPYIKTFNITGPTTVNAGDSLQIYIKAKVRN